MTRKFKASVSRNSGVTWNKLRPAQAWPIDVEAKGKVPADGYVISLTDGDTMIDIEMTERDLQLMLKDIGKKQEAYRVFKGQ